jgi:DNA-binding transcriptional regulator/RsmH inhibitor MraZ
MALAESPHEEEASLAAERATKLMLRWVIETSELQGDAPAEEPVALEVALPGPAGGLFEVFSLLSAIAEAYGCLAYFRRWDGAASGTRAIAPVATLAGFAPEAEAVQRLFESLSWVMIASMRAEWNDLKRRAKAEYEAELALQGRLGARVQMSDRGRAAFQRGFSQGFTSRVGARLRAARAAVDAEERGSGRELVLVGRRDRVEVWAKEALETHTEQIRGARASQRGWEAGAATGDRAHIGLPEVTN